ncbi:FadR/GntR family transcriptional regulator [Thalassospira marina]|uniref:GntR family transcriptional regulator n=1 Tax=Thalassospira marina TaxID=2048283 RepID=A0A2N3KTD6_9PROT|nr:FCD domain-containing protein [Thalassospira marina]AUG55754.1 GntR family transcriptional regulator [Thalassospira marina]PKR53849.1 GntR family transcriptional regulator [Thalassospira marina]
MRKPNNLKRLTPIAGTIEVRGILGAAVANLGVRIVGGEWPVGSVIAKEADLVAELDVSRSVIREACRILGAKGLIRSRTSDGTRVQPRAEWRLLDPDVMDWRIQAGDREGLLRDLLKFRLVLEPGIAYSATVMANDAARQKIDAAWQAKQAVYEDTTLNEHDRRAAFIDTDLAFHQAFVEAVSSELLDQVFSVISSALELLFDHQLQALGRANRLIGMDGSHELHEDVYRAFANRDAARAEEAMRVLVHRAIEDAERGFEQ